MVRDMEIVDEDCLAETAEFTSTFEMPVAPLEVLRRNRLGGNTPPVRLPQGRDRTVAGVGVRVFTPDQVDGVYLHIHGGGWSFGSADGQDERLWRLAREARLAVVSGRVPACSRAPVPLRTRRLRGGRAMTLPPLHFTPEEASALAANTALRLTYADAAGRETERGVEPAGLLTTDGRWYLIGWCRSRRAGRGFRLDRIVSAPGTAERVQPRDLNELLRDSMAARAVRPRDAGSPECSSGPSTSSGRLTGREGVTAPKA